MEMHDDREQQQFYKSKNKLFIIKFFSFYGLLKNV